MVETWKQVRIGFLDSLDTLKSFALAPFPATGEAAPLESVATREQTPRQLPANQSNKRHPSNQLSFRTVLLLKFGLVLDATQGERNQVLDISVSLALP